MSTSIPSFRQMGKVLDTMTEKGVTGDLLQNELLGLDLLLPEQIILTIDYGMNLEQMITAGHYDFEEGDITAKYFPIVGLGKVQYEMKLFHLNRVISSKHAKALIKADDPINPWEPCKIEHLLAFGEKYPNKQRECPVIALGSVAKVEGFQYVVHLDGGGSERTIRLSQWVGDWDVDFRFLAVRKISVS